MSKSIMQNKKVCYITGSTLNLHKHHIFKGCYRKKAEKYGCWVWLRADWHNMSNYGVHFNKELDTRLKKECQRKFEALYDRDTFMREFGQNYLWEEE